MGEKFKGKVDELKGRGKQAAGDITGRDELKREGKIDEATGKIRQKIDDVGEKLGDLADSARDKVRDATDR